MQGPNDEAEKIKSQVEETDTNSEVKKSNEKLNQHLIFLPPETASQPDLPKYFKKRGRQRTMVKTKGVIVYRLTRRKWPYGLSDYMCWYYDFYYIKRGSKNYGKTQQWKQEIKQAGSTDITA